MSNTPRSYFREALVEPAHGLALTFMGIGCAWSFWTGDPWRALLGVAFEAGFLVVYPRLPHHRRRCEERWAWAERDERRARLSQLSRKLGANSQSRLRGLGQKRDTVLHQLSAMPGGESVHARWKERLEELEDEALRLLIALDGAPKPEQDDTAEQVAKLKKEVESAAPGAVRDAKQQRLAALEARGTRTPGIAEQAEVARVQLDTLEDLLEDLVHASLEGRDAQAFSVRLTQVQGLIEAARQNTAALDAHATENALRAEVKRLG